MYSECKQIKYSINNPIKNPIEDTIVYSFIFKSFDDIKLTIYESLCKINKIAIMLKCKLLHNINTIKCQ